MTISIDFAIRVLEANAVDYRYKEDENGDMQKVYSAVNYAEFVYHSGIAEQGYDDKPCIIGNWNHVRPVIKHWLERQLPDVEMGLWSDEWMQCEHCGKLVRSTGDSYGWTAHYIIFNECEVVCLDCLMENWEDWKDELLETYAYTADGTQHSGQFRAFLPLLIPYLERSGFVCLDDGEHAACKRFETGWHSGQNDHPQEVIDTLSNDADFKNCTLIFAVNSVGQFDVSWSVWLKPAEEPED